MPWSCSAIRFFDLSVGDFRRTLVEQPWACPDDRGTVVYFDELADMGWTFFEDSHQSGVVVSDGYGGLEHELDLAFWGVGIAVEYFSEGSFTRLLHDQFYSFDAVKRVFVLLEVGILIKKRKASTLAGCFASQM